MEPPEIVGRKPRLAGLAFRVLFLTLLAALLAFALGLLGGILGTVIAGALHGSRPDMTHAYRYIAFPFALVVAAVCLIAVSIHEIRHYRRRLALWRGF